MTPEDLVRRSDRLLSDRMTFASHWQEVANYILPSREFTTQSAPGSKRTAPRIFNTTPVLAAEQLAGALHGMLTSPALRWFRLRAEDPAFEGDEEADRWFEAATDRLYAVFTSARAGFDVALHEVYLDIAAFGMGVPFIADMGREGPRFEARPLAECCVAADHTGRIDTLMRRYKMAARQVAKLWPKTVPESVTKKMEKEPDTPVELLHAVYPRPEGEAGKPVASKYLALDGKVVLEDGGFEEFPFAPARWSKRSGEDYGYGPGMACLPDIKLVNKIEEEHLRSVQVYGRPPLMLPDDGFLGPLDLLPGGLNYARLDGPGFDRVGPLFQPPTPRDVREEIMAVEDRVRRGFYIDWMNLPTKPQMTATEVLQRRDEMLRLMGPMVARLQAELLGPIIERTFNIMWRNRLLPQPPESLSGQGYQVEYLSPLALAQKSNDADAALRWLQSVGGMAQFDPAAIDVVDTDEMVRFLADRQGAPSRVVRSKEAAAELAAQRAEQQAAAAQIAGAQGIASAVKDGAAALGQMAPAA